jgi:polar amino acid transport system permease protein
MTDISKQAALPSAGKRADGPDFQAVPLRHPWRWFGAALTVFFLLGVLELLITNPRWEWPVVAEYLFSDIVLEGVTWTIVLTILAEIVGMTFGIALAIMRLSLNPVLSWTSAAFIWIFRGLPPLVLLLFFYFFSILVPKIAIGIPFGPKWEIADTNLVMTQMFVAVFGLGLAQAAYVAEIVRGGILSVSFGQTRAAMALGMTPMQVMRHIVFPQAMRVIVPPLGNEVISMVKATSLVSVIAYQELLTTVQIIYSRTFQQIPLLMVAVIWYGVLTTVLTVLQSYIERRLSKSLRSQRPKG